MDKGVPFLQKGTRDVSPLFKKVVLPAGRRAELGTVQMRPGLQTRLTFVLVRGARCVVRGAALRVE